MRISDWSSDVCSSDLFAPAGPGRGRWAGRGRSVVVRPPAGRPGLADVLQVAADRLHLQVDGCVAGENQGDRARPRVDGEQVEDLVVVAGLHAALAQDRKSVV